MSGSRDNEISSRSCVSQHQMDDGENGRTVLPQLQAPDSSSLVDTTSDYSCVTIQGTDDCSGSVGMVWYGICSSFTTNIIISIPFVELAVK